MASRLDEASSVLGNIYHNSEASTTLSNNLMALVGKIGNANWRSALGGRRSHVEVLTKLEGGSEKYQMESIKTKFNKELNTA